LFHSKVSVFAVDPGAGDVVPPNATADVVVPDPANPLLAVFKSFTSVQEDPS
jgi:hypothetical protein